MKPKKQNKKNCFTEVQKTAKKKINAYKNKDIKTNFSFLTLIDKKFGKQVQQ